MIPSIVHTLISILSRFGSQFHNYHLLYCRRVGRQSIRHTLMRNRRRRTNLKRKRKIYIVVSLHFDYFLNILASKELKWISGCLCVFETFTEPPIKATALTEVWRYRTRPSQFNWGPKNVHVGKMHFRTQILTLGFFDLLQKFR